MKKLLIVLIISLLVGCLTTQKHASQMFDWELLNKYNELQIIHMQLERKMMYETPSYMYLPFGNSLMALPMKSNFPEELTKIERRQTEIVDEMSKRGILP
jgi:hypothetical protein